MDVAFLLVIVTNIYMLYSQFVCESGEYCDLSCNDGIFDASSCKTIVDGSFASFLNVKCRNNGYCSGTTFVCPIGGCSITCNGIEACKSVTINIPTNGNVTILCLQQIACESMKVYANYAKSVILNAYGSRSFSSSSLQARYVESVAINVLKGSFTINECDLFLEFAQSVVVSLGNEFRASFKTNWYLPSNTIFNCYGRSCLFYLDNIYSRSNISQFIFNFYACNTVKRMQDFTVGSNIRCNFDSSSYQTVSYCSIITETNKNNVSYDCGCNELYYNGRISFHTSLIPRLCFPHLEETRYTPCIAGKQCDIQCTDNRVENCTGQYIDGSSYSHLTLTCDSGGKCVNSSIICPLAGCSITCSAQHSCHQITISYIGDAMIDGRDRGVVTLDCINNEACFGIVVDVNYASAVLINGYGSHAFSTGVVYATYADKAEIKCKSKGHLSGCDNSIYYVPADTIIFCYGTGCSNMGALYINNDTDKAEIRINGCDECHSTHSCLVYAPSFVCQSKNDAWFNSNSCVQVTDSIFVQFNDDTDDPYCDHDDSSLSPGAIVGIIIGSLVFCFCFVFCVTEAALYEKKQNAPNEDVKVSSIYPGDTAGANSVELEPIKDVISAPDMDIADIGGNEPGNNKHDMSNDEEFEEKTSPPADTHGNYGISGKGEGGGNEGGETDIVNDLEMNGTELLIHWNFGKYIKPMIEEQGWIDPLEWHYLRENDLRNDIGFKDAQIRKFMDKYKDWSQRKNKNLL